MSRGLETGLARALRAAGAAGGRAGQGSRRKAARGARWRGRGGRATPRACGRRGVGLPGDARRERTGEWEWGRLKSQGCRGGAGK